MNISCIVRRGWSICSEFLTIILLITIISSLSQVLKEIEFTYCPKKDRINAVNICELWTQWTRNGSSWYSTNRQWNVSLFMPFRTSWIIHCLMIGLLFNTTEQNCKTQRKGQFCDPQMSLFHIKFTKTHIKFTKIVFEILRFLGFHVL